MGKKINVKKEIKKEIEEGLKSLENGDLDETVEVHLAEEIANEEIKEEVPEVVEKTKEEPKVEEPKQEDINQKPQRSKKWLIILLCTIIVVLLLLIILVVINKNSNKENNKKEDKKIEEKKEDKKEDKKEEQKQEEKKEEQQEEKEEHKEETPEKKDDDVDYINLKVKNVNSSKNYEVQLARKYDKNHDKHDDGYSYAFYNKTTDKMMTGYDYTNVTCSSNCSTDPNDYGCIETNTNAFSFKVNGIDYIYATYIINVCGALDTNYIIYDTKNEKIALEGRGGTDNVTLINNHIFINYDEAGDDVCGSRGIGVFDCEGDSGFIYHDGERFAIVKGEGSVNLEKGFAIIEYNENLNPNNFAVSIYGEYGYRESTIKDCIAYNEDYIVAFEGDNLIVKDYQNKKVGNVDSVKFDTNKYEYSPHLQKEDGKYILTYYLKSDESASFNSALNINY